MKIYENLKNGMKNGLNTEELHDYLLELIRSYLLELSENMDINFQTNTSTKDLIIGINSVIHEQSTRKKINQKLIEELLNVIGRMQKQNVEFIKSKDINLKNKPVFAFNYDRKLKSINYYYKGDNLAEVLKILDFIDEEFILVKSSVTKTLK